ncbi:MAG: alanine racemase [Gemmatimonadota bacterium]|nr:alanine racemase [Gemmatimonadota bacterium]
MSTELGTRAWVEVDASALRENLRRIAHRVGPEARLIPMVKADAYGLGVLQAVDALEPMDPWGFGVAAVDEGLALRRHGVRRPVLVLSPAPREALEAAVAAELEVSVSDAGTLDRLVALAEGGASPAFHLEVDTGMGRAGIPSAEAEHWIPLLERARAAGVRWAGCYTHLHSADESAGSVHEQWRRFEGALGVLRARETGVLVHVLNSAGCMRCPEYGCDAVRPGIFLYGGGVGADQPRPESVAALRARVVHVRDAAPGTPLGYGSTYRAVGHERWATVCIGYGDGLPRGLGNRGEALVRGRRAAIVGRISMDVTVVDITDVPDVAVGDVVTFIGNDGDQRITVDEVAEMVGTISYEVLTGLTPRVQRIWVHDSTR